MKKDGDHVGCVVCRLVPFRVFCAVAAVVSALHGSLLLSVKKIRVKKIEDGWQSKEA